MYQTSDTSVLAKQMSLARKCEKHGLNHQNWREKVQSWHTVRLDDNKLNFDHIFLLCENAFGDDWVWSKDILYGYEIYLTSEEDVVIFKLKYEGISKQVS